MKKKSLLRIIWSGFTTLLVVLAVLLAIALAGVRLIGYTPYAVLSGSMAPQYQVGDLVYVQKCAPEDIQPGDVIAFVANENLTVVTHRVVEADRAARSFTTKGDANASVDGRPVLYENVLGRVGFSLPKLGYLSQYLSTPSGRYAGIAAVLAVLLIMLLPSVFRKKHGSTGDASPPENKG